MKYGHIRPHFRQDIEGLRAVAILLVVANHAGLPFMTGGYVGVDVFFVISGYVITLLLIRESEKEHHIDLWRFFSRRARRLLPALLLVALTSGVYVAIFYAPFEQRAIFNSLISALASLSNIYFIISSLDYYGDDASLNPFLHTWSLGVEEQFYLVWPVIIYLVLHGMRQSTDLTVFKHRLALLLVTISIASLIACVLVTTERKVWAFYGMPFRVWEFGVGALIAIFARSNTGGVVVRLRKAASIFGGRWKGLVAIGFLVGIVMSAAMLNETTPFPG